MRRSSSMPLLMCLAAGCAGDNRVAGAPIARTAPGGWRAVVTAADRARLRTWRESWVAALARANSGSARARVRAEGALLEPDRALPDPAPPPGDYRCRMTKLGAASAGLLDYVAYPPFRCRVSAAPGGALSFAKLDGSQRPVGTFYPQDSARMIFLGTMMLADERRALDYGRDPQRDMAGAVERIGPHRWRLVLPAPHWESLLDVMELVPA